MLEFIKDVVAIDTGEEGRSVIRHEGRVIFVKGLVPGDIADIEIIKTKKGFAEGKIVKIQKFSLSHITPKCLHFGICGGCSWQHLDYRSQLQFKQKHVVDAIKRIGKTEAEEVLPIIGSDDTYYYRNKLEFSFSSRRWLTYEEMVNKSNFNQPGLGFHLPGLFDKVLDLSECHLQREPSNSIRKAIRAFAIKERIPFFDMRLKEGLLRNLIIRTTASGEVMVLIVFYGENINEIEKIMEYIKSSFPALNSLLYCVNSKMNDTLDDIDIKVFSGEGYINEKLILKNGKELTFRISARSFFQTNTGQANKLYLKVSEFASFKGNESVYDLYCGCGTISCFIAGEVANVKGLEYVKQAVDDARRNSALNNILNTEYFAGDIKELLTEEFCRHNGLPDVIITDPPRAGMNDEVILALLKIAPRKIIYISCNPSTQARDISMLSDKYVIKKIQPVDMFPHTSHIENICLMELK